MQQHWYRSAINPSTHHSTLPSIHVQFSSCKVNKFDSIVCECTRLRAVIQSLGWRRQELGQLVLRTAKSPFLMLVRAA